MNFKKYILVMSFLFVSRSAFSVTIIDCGIEKIPFLLETVNGPDSKCEVSSELGLAYKTALFPNLKPEKRKVHYWKGGYRGEKSVLDIYLYWVVNTCQVNDVLSSYEEEVPRKEFKVFNVENPNLDELIDSSLYLTPMTDVEAKKEMDRVHSKCKEFIQSKD